MKLDDELCLCFHVTRRKVVQFIRVKRPEVASQLSECFGAGTGCGWCRPYLERIFQMEKSSSDSRTVDKPHAGDDLPRVEGEPRVTDEPRVDGMSQVDDLPDAAEYARSRSVYRAARQSRPSEP